MTEKYRMIDLLGNAVAEADQIGIADAEIVKALVFVSIEECFRRAENNESAILVMVSALYTKISDVLGLSNVGFDNSTSERGRH